MRFLCFHGLGTNSEIFSAQTAALRYELGEDHAFDFVEGTVPAPMALGMEKFTQHNDSFFVYFEQSPESVLRALSELRVFIEHEGPYDGILAFSHGAGFAATFLQQQALLQPERPLFKCAIFLSGYKPVDLAATTSHKFQFTGSAEPGAMIELPTAHIYGLNDELYPGTSEQLMHVCAPGPRSVFMHEEGHTIPGSRTPAVLLGAVKCIQTAMSMTD